MKVSDSYQPSFLFDEEILKNILENEIKKLEKPSIRCLKYIETELMKMMNFIQIEQIQPFENLKEALEDVKLSEKLPLRNSNLS